MAELVAQLADALRADVPLMALLPGGVHERPLKPNIASGAVETPGSTPQAFDVLGRLQWAASITSAPSTLVLTNAPLNAYQVQPVVWVYSPSVDAEVGTFELVWGHVYRILHGTTMAGPNGTGVAMQVMGWFGPLAAIDLKDAVAMRIPLIGHGVWSVD